MDRRRWNHETIKQVLDGEHPFIHIQVGYTGKPVKHKDGDEWTDAKGITWKKENGGISRVNKQMDSIREMIKPKCSKCGTRIDFSCSKLDHAVFPRTGMCYDCLEAYEFELRVLGKYDDYEKMKILKNKRGMLEEFKQKVIESIHYLKNESGKVEDVLSSGEIVAFTGKCNPQWLVDAEDDLLKVNEELIKMDKEISEFETSLTKK
jgi:hypothetical protein